MERDIGCSLRGNAGLCAFFLWSQGITHSWPINMFTIQEALLSLSVWTFYQGLITVAMINYIIGHVIELNIQTSTLPGTLSGATWSHIIA